YLALLRGINVGGGNIITMTHLKACFEANKLHNVATYIQSGNVLFETAETDPVKLVRRLEQALSKTFTPYRARVVLCAHTKLREIVREAPKGFGRQPQKYRYDVIYLKEPLTAAEALQIVTTKPGVDRVFAGPDVLYFSRLIARATQSHLSRVVALSVYQNMTIRNWNTTIKLLALMDARAAC
ncbi:MAG TPA: DUF1697 domain-containing protein, partial [Pyrinomonadaceae bacterium]|nr:DUF1697 domain-containing protein [Pyrinomonadaceae bacterium]